MMSREMVVEVRKVKELSANSDVESRVTQVKGGQRHVIQLLHRFNRFGRITERSGYGLRCLIKN